MLDKVISGEIIFQTSEKQLDEIKEVLERPKFGNIITKKEVTDLILLLHFLSELVIPDNRINQGDGSRGC